MNREQIFIEFAKMASKDTAYYERGTYGIIEDVLAMFNLKSQKFIGAKSFVHQENLETLHNFIISDNCTDEQARKVYKIATGKDEPLKIDYSSNIAGKVFVGMVMNKEQFAEVESLHSAIEQAINRTNNESYFADKSSKSEYIMEGIKENIQNCKFAIIDLTTNNNGAYFEAGYAIALGKNVIISCSESDFNNVHFDLKQYRCLIWKDFKDLTEKLINRINEQKLAGN